MGPHLRLEARAAAAAILALGLVLSTPARADGPIGPNGSRITTSQYRIDLTQTPVLAGARPLALGGAYVALAEGTDGDFQNAAAPAIRVPYSFDWFDWDLGLNVVSTSAVEQNDFFNTGQPTVTGTQKNADAFVNVALNLQFGHWGGGLAVESQTYALRAADDARLGVTINSVHAQLARAFFDRQLVVGAGPRIVDLQVLRPNPPEGESGILLASVGLAAEVGAVLKPNEQPYRIGVSYRTQILNDLTDKPPVPPNAQGDYVYGDPTSTNAVFLPRAPALPWDLQIGGAFQLGPRPLNPTWPDPSEQARDAETAYRDREQERRAEREALLGEPRGNDRDRALDALEERHDRERKADRRALSDEKDRLRTGRRKAYLAMARPYVLFTASVLITGPVSNAVGVESLLRQRVDRSGQRLTFEPRLGVESEPLAHWLKLRMGSYYEPTRFNNGRAGPRLHGTAGIELKILPWTVFGLFDDPTWWRAGAVMDLSDQFFSYGFTAGIWH